MVEQTEIVRLRIENENLRSENAALKALLASGTPNLKSPAMSASASSASNTVPSSLEHHGLNKQQVILHFNTFPLYLSHAR
jgi:hypothetical protein